MNEDEKKKETKTKRTNGLRKRKDGALETECKRETPMEIPSPLPNVQRRLPNDEVPAKIL